MPKGIYAIAEFKCEDCHTIARLPNSTEAVAVGWRRGDDDKWYCPTCSDTH